MYLNTKIFKRFTSILLLLLPWTVVAETVPQLYQPGIHYQLVEPVQRVAVTDKVEIIEFLWYGCETCFIMQPELKRWQDSRHTDISYRRIPAIINDEMVLLARAFYAARALDIQDKIHGPLFDAIHRFQRRLVTEQALQEFFSEHGVSEKNFRQAFNSSFSAGKVRNARLMSQRYGVAGAPAIIINGKYRIDPSMVTSPRGFIRVLDFLVSKEIKGHD